MSDINKQDLDNYITGHYGEDQFRDGDVMERRHLDKKEIGYVEFCRDDSVLEIGQLFVSPAFRGKGYARKLLKLALDEASRCNVSEVWLTVTVVEDDGGLSAEAVRRFYERCGFRSADSHGLMKRKATKPRRLR